MSKNKFSEDSKNSLNLGSLHEEVLKQKQRKKIGKLPIILVCIGIILILTGIFYNNIVDLIKSLTESKDTTKEIKKDQSITYLDCNYSKDDESLGIKKIINIKYEFKNNLLKKTSRIFTMTILDDNYDIGKKNIEVYYEKYNNSLKDININGLIIKNEIKNEKFKNTILIDYDTLDINQIPKNDYLTIQNKKDQTYREIKEIEGRALHICKKS